jgi:hypothetical protein
MQSIPMHEEISSASPYGFGRITASQKELNVPSAQNILARRSIGNTGESEKLLPAMNLGNCKQYRAAS